MKKTILLLLSMFMLTGCGFNFAAAPGSEPSSSSETNTSTNTSNSSSKDEPIISSEEEEVTSITEPVTIEIWHSFNSTYATLLESFVEEFTQINPFITIELVRKAGTIDDLFETIKTSTQTGSHPDISFTYRQNIAELVDYDMVARLDEIDNWKNIDTSDFLPYVIEAGSSYQKEGMYSMPFAPTCEVMFYNHTVLDGLDLSSYDPSINNGNPLDHDYITNLTWETFFNNLCPALEQYNNSLPESKKIYEGYIMGYDSDNTLFQTVAEQYDYEYLDVNEATHKGEILFNNDNMKSLMHMFHEAHQKGYITTKSVEGTYVNYAFTEERMLFSISVNTSYRYQASTNFTTVPAKIPGAENGSQVCLSSGQDAYILKHNAQRELASSLFIEFITNEENAALWTAIGQSYSPIRYSTFKHEAFKQMIDENDFSNDSSRMLLNRIYNYIETDNLEYYVPRHFNGYDNCFSTFEDIVNSCLTSNNLIQEINEIFASAEQVCKQYVK